MTLADLRGQDRARAALSRALGDRPAHAYLFHGPVGVGKERAARILAASLLCGARDGVDACGSCPSCTKLERATHPDLEVLLPAAEAVARGILAKADVDGTPSRSIRVAEVRTLSAWLLGRPVDGDSRVALVLDAHRMGTEAQNALLKTLEEPRPGRTLVLVSSAPSGLLATIRSRCQQIRFGALPDDLVRDLLREHGVDGELVDRAAAAGRGSISRALALARRGPATLRVRDALLGLRAEAPIEVLDLAEDVRGDRAAATRLVELVTELLGDALREPDPDDSGAIASLDPARASALLERARATGRELARGANTALVVEDLLFEIAGY